ncbi:hypothetical protein HDV00_008937 [Rhizophlyctis rosea]|nr:hypothetical protein HDV00_008937 [Rhizophlyctis rosea]
MTTAEGQARAKHELARRDGPLPSKLTVVPFETLRNGQIDLAKALARLKSEFGVRYLDISAGGRTIRSFIDLGVIDEIRMTVANQIAGHVNTSNQLRPHAYPHDANSFRTYNPDTSPLVAWKGIRMAGEHFMFYRGVYQYRHLGS